MTIPNALSSGWLLALDSSSREYPVEPPAATEDAIAPVRTDAVPHHVDDAVGEMQ